MADVDIVVVGGGPVGETLLVQLGHRGIRAIGLERDVAVWPKPRAVHFDSEVFRSLQPVGLAGPVAELCTPMRSYRMENEAGEVLQNFPTDGITMNGWIQANMFNQPEIDALLRREIDRLPGVALRCGRTVTGITQDTDEVVVTARTPGGDEETITARYVVGCDGATSTVRKLLGIDWEVLGDDDLWLVADGLLPMTDGRDRAPIEGSMVFYGHHSRPKVWARMPGRRARMEFKILPGDDADTICTPEAVSRMSGGVLTPENFELVRTAVYTFRSRLAQRWRVGRILLAGDAAHLMPPLFGQGMCSGIRDAANLAWKLALVLDGAPSRLLDTYESERSAHVRGWIEHATAMSRFMQTTDPVVAEQRDAHIRAHPAQSMPVAPALGPGLHTEDPPAGRLAPQPLLADGRRFDDLIGRDFSVVGHPTLLAELPADLRDALATHPRVTLVDPDTPGTAEFLAALAGLMPEAPAAGGPLAAVVRPDRYLLGAATNGHELTAQCRMALGACGGDLREPLSV